MADWVSASYSAAALKLDKRAVASNALSGPTDSERVLMRDMTHTVVDGQSIKLNFN